MPSLTAKKRLRVRKKHMILDHFYQFSNRVTCPCMYCGKFLKREQATIEHIVRLADGGSNNRSNIGVACLKCNTKRHNIPSQEYKKIRSQDQIIPDLIFIIGN